MKVAVALAHMAIETSHLKEIPQGVECVRRRLLQGIDLLNRGAAPRPPFTRPTLGSVLAQQLGHLDNPVPNFILLDPCPEGNEFKEFKAGNWAGWLGAQYAPVRVGGNIKPPTKTKDVRPTYPAIAQSARVQGVVIVEATIGPDGRVAEAKVLRSIPLLDAAALDAVRQWQFTPTLLNGQAVPVIMTVTVNFTLQ